MSQFETDAEGGTVTFGPGIYLGDGLIFIIAAADGALLTCITKSCINLSFSQHRAGLQGIYRL